MIARIDNGSQPTNHIRNSDPLARRQVPGKDTTKTTDGDNVVTISKAQGTTGDKTGYSWHAVGSTAGLVKSQGTTHDRVGLSWRSLGLK
jgi:hypothetical protein